MFIRKAERHELDTIYAIGFDVWGDGLSYEKYVAGCRGSNKYQAGTWYVLIDNDQILSSLIVYQNIFGLKEGCAGIGSVATPNSLRGRGYASDLINSVKKELYINHNVKAIFLHSDIPPKFYQRLGFTTIKGSDCMYISMDTYDFDGSLPAYF
ncbi:GNAT family N-acetyltransferase [Photobacterium angustum]|uniref:GNAT family N-acetyltransferase n=1 Tax=Photobacterium angustum TaxID=661 RepID=UPI0005E212ED|nr:GNAT family N-acetyltransferase [Photobacterium angustum]KJF95875.1 acetyltransferase [Photobacterium angustum]PSW80185.1 N-acetyltransferase [Photobacterium angustum]